MATLFVDKIDPQSGTSLEIGSSGDTITIPSGATIVNSGTQTGFGGTNTPAFRAFMNANQNLVNSTVTKIDQFGTEDFDTNSDFASNRFTPTVAGKYFVYAQLGFTNSVLADVSEFAKTMIYKNGSELVRNFIDPKDTAQFNQAGCYVATVVEMNGSSDYLEVYAIAISGTGSGNVPKVGNGTTQSFFGAYKIIE
jgi:hypothetical protein